MRFLRHFCLKKRMNTAPSFPKRLEQAEKSPRSIARGLD
jgi:hypothetical protein